MRSLLLGLLVALPVLAQAQQRPVPDDTVATHYQLPQADCALFPATARLPDDAGYYVTRTGRFTPTPQQVAEAEQALAGLDLTTVYDPEVPAHMRRYYAHHPALIKAHLSEYQRQYYGLYNEQHQPCLYLNFFIERMEYAPGMLPGWLRAPVQARDGGAAFWHIYYNLNTHRFYNFSSNGEG